MLSNFPIVFRIPDFVFNRTAFAAALIVSATMVERDSWIGRTPIDWESKMRIQYYLWDQGFGLAEAMDSAHVDWLTAKELIQRTMRSANADPLKSRGAFGAGADHLTPDQLNSDIYNYAIVVSL